MHLIDKMKGMKGIGLTRPGSRSPYIHSPDCSRRAEDHGASCGTFQVLGVSHLEAGTSVMALFIVHP